MIATALMYASQDKDIGLIDLMDVIADSRVTFTRAGNRTYHDAAGVLQTAGTDVWPREFDPATGLCLGRSVWAAATNLSLRSQEFNDASWAPTRSSISANTVATPDGTTTADKLIEDSTASDTHFVRNAANITVTTATVYTMSVFAKASERSWLALQEGQGVTATAYFNLSTGALGTVSGTGSPSASIDSVGGGWYRCRLTFTSLGTAARIRCYLATGDGTAIYTGDGASGLHLWGAQFELGAIATPYIPTTSATVTRAADVAVVSTLSSIGFNASEGTFIVEAVTCDTSAVPDTERLLEINDNTANERFLIYRVTSTPKMRFLITDGGVSASNIDSAELARDTAFRISAAYKLNDCGISVNGASAVTISSATMPTVDRMQIGSSTSLVGTTYWNSWIKRILYIPRRLTNAELQAASKL